MIFESAELKSNIPLVWGGGDCFWEVNTCTCMHSGFGTERVWSRAPSSSSVCSNLWMVTQM